MVNAVKFPVPGVVAPILKLFIVPGVNPEAAEIVIFPGVPVPVAVV
jgi:hypothetical protein